MNQPKLFSPHRALSAALVLPALLIWNGVAAQAQTPPSAAAPDQSAEIDALRQQLAELKARLDTLESEQKASKANANMAANAAKTAAAKTAAAPTAAAPTAAAPTAAAPTAAAPTAATVNTATKTPLIVSGLLQVHSLNFLDENIHNNGLPSRDTFRLRRGELRLTAPSITSRISGTIMVDPAKTTSLRGNSSTGTIRERDNILQEIQISGLLRKRGADAHFLDVGQFKIPVGYESTLTSSSALPLVERSLIFSQRDPFDGGYGDVRDTGVQLRGNFSKLDYRVGLFNGLGDRQNALALSDQKAVLGLLAYRGIKGLTLGISGGRGNTGVQNFVTTNGVTTTVISRDNRSLFNAFGVYKFRKLSLQAEYLRGQAAPIVVATNTLAGRDIQGYYGSIGYLFSPKIEGIFRYDTLDTNRSASDASVRDLIVGLNYYIKGNNAKIQTNLVQRNGGDNAPTNLNPSNNLRNNRLELRTALQIAF